MLRSGSARAGNRAAVGSKPERATSKRAKAGKRRTPAGLESGGCHPHVPGVGLNRNRPMRQDKLTTRFQEALADAQSRALGNDNQYTEPLHLLGAMLRQDDGAARALLQRAGVVVGPLAQAIDGAIKRLPQVQGTDGQVQVSRELLGLLNQTEKE